MIRDMGFAVPIEQLDISEIESELRELDSEDDVYLYYSRLLSHFPDSQEQIPALVMGSNELDALVWAKNRGEITLNLNQAGWARKYLTANLRGDKPKSMVELLQPGDIVYIQPADQIATAQASESTNETQPKNSIEENTLWRLSQIPNISGANNIH